MSSWNNVMVIVLLSIVPFASCAKQPLTAQASAPAPVEVRRAETPAAAPAGSTERPGPAVAPIRPTPVGPAGAPRPLPREFSEVPQLRDIHFDFDQYQIRPGDAKILDANAEWLKASPGSLLLVEGHCDERGTNEYNLALGERRSRAAMSYLVARGIPASRISLVTYGEERPACSEQREACWARNRRAHFLAKAG
jgi:peptidoglycan-associated lipoprotein